MHERIEDHQIEHALEDFVKAHCGRIGWPVYRDYEIQEENGEEYVVAPLTPESVLRPIRKRDGWQMYSLRDPREEAMILYAPLRTPELVLDLAELADKPIVAEDVQGWAEIYGLLGLPEHDEVAEMGSWSGFARRDSVRDFADAASRVRDCLRAYELAIAPEPPVQEEPGTWIGSLPKKALPKWMPRFEGDQQWILETVATTVQLGLKEHCYPMLTIGTENKLPSGRFSLGYGFSNLLGAVWLQMARILESGTERARVCRLPECTRLIYFEPGEPSQVDTENDNVRGKQKTHKNKVFCDGLGHRQKYNYRKKAGWPNYY